MSNKPKYAGVRNCAEEIEVNKHIHCVFDSLQTFPILFDPLMAFLDDRAKDFNEGREELMPDNSMG